MNDTNPFGVRRLDGLVAVVTGGNGGLGSAIADRLASEGAGTALIDIGEPREDARFPTFVADLTRVSEVGSAFDAISARFGAIDILVNNVGGGGSPARHLVDLDVEYWNASLANNLTSTFLCTQAFARYAIEHKRPGRVVNIASLSGKVGTPLLGPYAVSKAGVIRLTEVFARELAGHSIRVNAVCPSVIDTPLSDRMLARHPDTFVRAYDLAVDPDLGARRALEDKVPLRRLGSPADVAAMVAFLASDDAAYVTGQAFNLNGGLITH